MAQFATVAAITGNGTVLAVDVQGKTRVLKVGDTLQKGETVRTVGDVRVELIMEDGHHLAVAPAQSVRLDDNVVQSDQLPTAQDSAVVTPATAETVIQALERGTDLNQSLEATAAGLAPGGGVDGGSTFVQLLRITEGVSPLAYEYNFVPPELQPDIEAIPEPVPPTVSVGVTVGVQVGVGEGGPNLITGDIIHGAVSTVNVLEGSSGGGRAVTFLITLDKVSATDVTITYTIVPGTASNPADYFDGAPTQTVTIPAGYIGFFVTENIVGDTIVEANETFTIVLSNPIGATLINDTATVTIIDDDVSITAQGGQGDESGGLVTLTGALVADFGPGDTGTVSLSATGATWNAGSNTLTADNGTWKVVVNSNGTYTFTQLHAFTHSDPTNPNDPFNIPITATATDNMVPANSNTTAFTITVLDDAPSITVSATAAADALVVDETVLATNATANFADNFTSAFGADGAGTLTYAVGFNAGSTGLVDTATGQAVVLSVSGGVVEGRTAISGDLVFTVSVNASGTVTLDQLRAVVHSPDTGPDQSTSLATANLVTLTATITDKDGDSSSATINLGSAISFKDDAPVVLSKTDLIYANSSNDGVGPALGGTGIFDYNIGADSRTTFSASNSDFSTITLTGTVGTNTLQHVSTSWISESGTSAVFNFEFDYAKDPTNPTVLTHDTGVLTFDKVAGTYTVELASPIDSFSTLATSSGTSFVGYQAGTSTVDTTQPDVMVTTLASNFFVQFTGDHSTGGGSGVPLTAGVNGVGGDNAYTGGELFAAADTWVSVSGTANGVAGDTIGKGEVLDFRFYSTNPTGVIGVPTAQATSMYLRFDGIGNTEDIVVNLRLYDTVTHASTTLAVVVDNADILKHGDTLPAGYTGIAALDSNDGLVIIESNDYNTATSHYVIVGAQVLTSTEGITGSGVNLNSATGTTGGSSGTEDFGVITTDQDIVKVSDIGIVTQTTSTQDASLSFQFTNVDADGDLTASQTLNVTIEGSNTFIGTASAETIQGTTGNDILTGGGGSDTIFGNGGADTFVWHLADAGTTLAPAVDTVKDFGAGDVLQINDLLSSAGATITSGGQDASNTTLNITDTAGHTQSIVLEGYGSSHEAVASIISKLVADHSYTGV